MGEEFAEHWVIGRRGVRTAITALGLALALAASSVVVAPRASAEWAQPAFVETIGGSGRPGVFAWGLQYNPVSDELLVGDYLNYQVRRFTLDGDHLGDFFRSSNKGQPYSLGVDPNDGSVYVPEIADSNVAGTIAKYDYAGNFLYAVNTSADYYAWITVDATGDVLVADSHYWNKSGDPPRIRRYRFDDAAKSATEVASWPVLPEGMDVPRMYGIDAAVDGTVYASDTINKVVHRWEADGTYLGSFGDGHFVSDMRSVAIDDANGWVYVVDAHGGKVEKFTLDGVHSGTLGSLGPADGQLLAPRQATVGPAGQVYVADYGKSSVEEFDPDGTWVRSIPRPSRRSPAAHLAQPRDVDVDAVGNIWVADSWNQRVQKYAADGAAIATWGHRGSGLYGMNYPRGIAIDPATQNVWVAQERGHYIAVFDPTMTSRLFVVGSEGVDSASTGFLRWPNDIEFYDGNAYVGDRVSQRVKVFDATTGDELWRISRRNHGLAVDPATGDVFVVDDRGEQIYKYDSNGNLLFSFGSDGDGDGQFKEPKDAIVSGGVLWVTDEQLSRVQAFDLDGNFLGKWGGFGSNAYQFKNPVGITADASGKLYIADSGNDRIVVFDTTTTRPGYEWSPPSLSVSTPANGQVLSDPVMISGYASDDDAIANVEISVLDESTGLWWNGSTSTWDPTQTWHLGPLAGPGTTRSFSWAFLGATYGRSYESWVRARDSFDTVSSPVEVRAFSVSSVPGL
jgi:DNA-binding beta-propeller fold protein YncE